MVSAWIITIPAAAAAAAAIGLATRNGNAVGVVAVSALAVAGLAAVWLHSRRNPVNADNINNDANERELAPAA